MTCNISSKWNTQLEKTINQTNCSEKLESSLQYLSVKALKEKTLTMQASQKTLKNDQQSLDEMKMSLSIKR